MTYWDKIEEAETEARRFLNRVAALRKRYVEDEHIHVAGFKERATRLALGIKARVDGPVAGAGQFAEVLLMTDLIPPQKIAGLTPYVCEYQGPDGAYDITLYGSDPEQIITDHRDSLPGLKVVGILEGTIDNG
jgi:hypothetical protein